ncbi:MAG: prolipoprotein diacylglyceryl transferase [Candidatus Gracilibacteria bacterium]|nr:prolipoprotein diacylglyceryl transferase [Candidatus Gracilibacteria bacterium]
MQIFEITLFGITIAPTYYGLMYALGFLAGYYVIRYRTSSQPSTPGHSLLTEANSPCPLKEKEQEHLNSPLLQRRGVRGEVELLDDLLLYIVAGVILGGRLGYVIFYNLTSYIENPLDILKVWEGGMSFHGGVIGVIIAMYLFSKRYKVGFLKLSDEITAVLPIGLGLGRIGNYLNKELLGFPYNGPLAVNGNFPSPLLEALLEGVVLFIILNLVYKNRKFDGQIASLFLIFYGVFRIIVELFFRLPDANIGYIAGYFTLGTLLSIPMIIAGFYYYVKFSKKIK